MRRGERDIHGNALGVHLLVHVLGGVVGDDHTVGDDESGSVTVGGEEAHGVTRVHGEGLLVGHLAEVLHEEVVLSPVGEDGTVASVGDELMGELSNSLVEVVHDHELDGGGLTALGGVAGDGIGLHFVVGGAESVQVDVTVGLELLGELLSELGVILLGEVSEGVLDGKSELLLGEGDGTLGGVGNGGVKRERRAGQGD